MRHVTVLLALLALSCDAHTQLRLPLDAPGRVCQDVGYCQSQGDAWIAACQQQAAALRMEAAGSGCAASFDGYYACAADHYDCQGNTPVFLGCEGQLAALKSCLAAGEASNACGRLNAALAACARDGGAADGGAGDMPPPPCAGGSVCAALCYLQNVADVCAPRPTELSAAAQCAQMCPF